MKKYLMTGIAALALCVGFISCSHDFDSPTQEELNDLNVKKIVNTYNEAFKAYIGGEISPTQTWGFGTPVTSRTRTEDKNLNEWGDPTKEHGNWIVPPALTDDQKTRVMAYFQANPGLTYEDPHLTNFFIQQVYKGGTSPGAISSERYTQTNGNSLIGSDNMDWLYMGEGLDHVNDYNDGTWNLGVPYEVLNTGASANDHRGNTTHVEGVTHPDMITLMVNSSTEFVAYGSSTGNQYHTNCCALAGWDVIEAWAIAHRDSLTRIGKFGATLDDGWDRSFVGLDYEDRTIDNLYLTPKTNAKALDNNFIDGNSHWVLYQGTVYSFDDFRNTFGNFDFRDVKGGLVYYVTDNVSNQAIADYIKYTDKNNQVVNVTKDAYNYKLTKEQFKDLYNITINNQEDGLYDLDMILDYIRQSALPTEHNGNWVKNIGGRDYVYSDWIVTLTEANHQNTTPPTTSPADLRIMAEDLSAKERSDFDFNDIVFDVYFAKDNETTTKVVVRAAGGTLPLRIKVKSSAQHSDEATTGANGNGWQEVHDLWNLQTNIMINTGAEAMFGNGKGRDNMGSRRITLDWAVEDKEDANNITIEVLKTLSDGTSEWIEMTAHQGEPAAKFAIPAPDPDEENWCSERQSIKDTFETFAEWAQSGNALDFKWW